MTKPTPTATERAARALAEVMTAHELRRVRDQASDEHARRLFAHAVDRAEAQR